MSGAIADALIIGAGPCGLFQAFQLGLQGIKCHIVESQALPGGQCQQLYADKPIYDVPGIPHILAGDLSHQLLTQLAPFKPLFHYQQTVTAIEKNYEVFNVHLENNETLVAKNVILASGAGAFTPVKMRAPGADKLTAEQLHYTNFSHDEITDKRVLITGDSSDAIDEAVSCANVAAETTFIHRKRRLPESPQRQTLDQFSALTVMQGKIEAITTANGEIIVQIIMADKTNTQIPCDVIVARLGNSPKMPDYSSWGLATTRNHIDVCPATFETNIEGLYAIGDINHYKGKRKLILCGFHEATLAAFAVTARLNPGQPVHTQFTTTSTRLLKRLGVLSDI